MQVRATAIRTYDNRHAVIPNSDLLTGEVLVDTAYDMRWLQVRVGPGYRDDVGRAKRVIADAAHGIAGVRADPAPAVRVAELGDFAVQLDLFARIEPPQPSVVPRGAQPRVA
jgi:small conductance mechanosensitive channel